METIIFLLFIVAAFVWLVRRTKRKSAELNADSVRPPVKPAPPKPSGSPSPSRAIRTGWRLGTVTFTYEDAEGEITSRTVSVHSVNGVYLKGECHTRRAERTFRLDRIIGDVVDVETGEIIRAKALPRHFVQ